MILAAGRGTRLGELGRTLPKVLVEVGGEPLLARHLRYLEAEGVRRVVVNAHHLADQVCAWIAAWRGDVQVVCVEEPELLGTAGGVRNALGHLAPGPFVVVYGDILLADPLAPLVDAHRRHRAEATLAVHAAESVKGKGVVRLDEDDRVAGFVEKPDADGEQRAWINSGLYVLEESMIADLPAGAFLDFGQDVFPAALARDARIFAAPLEHGVVDLGTPEALELGRRMLS